MTDLYAKKVRTAFYWVNQERMKNGPMWLFLLSPRAFLKLSLMKYRRGGLGEYFDLNHSIRNRKIFVHIPKAAGRSVREGLMANRSASHLSTNLYRIALGDVLFDSCFKFSFVRHPYTRFYSAYNFLKAGGVSKRDKKYQKEYFAECDNINDFISNRFDEKLRDEILHFRPQTDFLYIDNKLAVDYLGYFENLEKDYAELCRILNLKVTKLPWNNSTAELMGNTTEKCQFNLTSESKTKLQKLYADDLRNFGYSS